MKEPTKTRHTSDLVSITAVATNTLIYTLSQGRTAKIKKIMLMNNTGANDTVVFGEVIAGVWTPRLPAIYVLQPFDEQLHEWQIPAYEFETDIYARSANALAATTMDVSIEVEEIA